MSRKFKVILTFIILLFLVASFLVGYLIGGQQAIRGFAQAPEVWAKDAGYRLSAGLSPDTIWLSDGSYRMYYTVAEGIASANSYNGLGLTRDDGMRLGPDPNNALQVKVGSPAVYELKNGQFRMIYEGSDDKQSKRVIFSAISQDGITWTRENGPRLRDQNQFGQDYAASPKVVQLPDGHLRMYYSNGSEIRSAVSSDEGLTWKKQRLSGIDETAVDCDVIVRDDGVFKMYYTASLSSTELKDLRIVSATSEDGINWIKDSGIRIMADKEAKMVFHPDVVRVSREKYRMYYCQLDSGDIEKAKSYDESPDISIRSAALDLAGSL